MPRQEEGVSWYGDTVMQWCSDAVCKLKYVTSQSFNHECFFFCFFLCFLSPCWISERQGCNHVLLIRAATFSCDMLWCDDKSAGGEVSASGGDLPQPVLQQPAQHRRQPSGRGALVTDWHWIAVTQLYFSGSLLLGRLEDPSVSGRWGLHLLHHSLPAVILDICCPLFSFFFNGNRENGVLPGEAWRYSRETPPALGIVSKSWGYTVRSVEHALGFVMLMKNWSSSRVGSG